MLIAFGGGLLLAAAVAAIVASGDEPGSEPASPNSLAVIDPENDRVVDTVPTGIDPADVSADADSVWVANRGDDSVTQVDPETRAVVGDEPRAHERRWAGGGSRRRLGGRQPGLGTGAARSRLSVGQHTRSDSRLVRRTSDTRP